MKILNLVLRIGLGVFLIVFGLNKFFDFLPPFEFADNEQHAADLLDAIINSYIWPLVGFLELMVGLLLVIRKWNPYAFVALVPLSINVVLFHATVNPSNIGPALAVAILNTYFIYKNWNHYRSMFS